MEPVTLSVLRAKFPDDRFLAFDVESERVTRCALSATAWSIRGRSAYWSADWVTAWSSADDAASVATDLVEHFAWQTSAGDASSVRGITCNDDVPLPSRSTIESANQWSWFWTDAALARVELSTDVVEVDHDDPRLLALLTHSPTASHERDGQRPAAWFGIERSGELLSVAAIRRVGDCFDLQSVVTHRDARGQGLSTTVCSHATALALRQVPVVALGMMTDNLVAERMYRRLGFSCEKRWQSARFAPTQHDA